MSELFEHVNKLIPYDTEITTYVCELAEYHPGFSLFLEYFLKKVSVSKIDEDINLLKSWLDLLQKHTNSVCSVHSTSINDYEYKMYDSIFLIGLYSILDGYINSGVLCDKLERAIGENAVDILSKWANKNPCSDYYGGNNAVLPPTDDNEKLYIDILLLQKDLGSLYRNRLFPLFESTSEKCGISCYAPQYYKKLSTSYGKYYNLYPAPGIVLHNDHVFDLRSNSIIKMDCESRSILAKCFSRMPNYLLSNNILHLLKLLNNGCVSDISLNDRLDRLYKKRKENEGIKGVLHLELTHKCNLNCKHCFNRTAKRNADIGLNEWRSIIDEFTSFGKHYTILFGGEPTLYKDIEQILIKLTDVGFPIELFTNATLIDDSYAQMLGKYHLAKIKVSIDGDNSLRGNGNFEKAMQGLESLKRYSNAPVFVNVTICDNNIAEIENIVRRCKELNADGIGFAPMQSMGNAAVNDLREIDVDSEIGITQFIINLGEKYHINVGMERFCEGPFDIFRATEDDLYTRATPCDFGVAMYYVRCDGMLAFCPDLADERFAVEITKDSIEKAGCNGIEELRYPTSVCSKCTLFYMCFGSCKATILRKHNNFDACDESNRERIQMTLDAVIKKYEGVK